MKRARKELLLAWVAALASLAVPASAQEAAPDPAQEAAAAPAPAPEVALPLWSAEERAAIELLRSLRNKERPSDAELASRLSAAEVRVLPLLFDILVARSVPALDSGKAQILSEVQEHILLLALSYLGREPVLAHLSAQFLLPPTRERRLAALASLGAVGRSNDFMQLFDLTLPPEEVGLDARLERGLRRAVATVLTHDALGFEQLATLRRVTRRELLPALVEAAGDTKDPRALQYLSEVAYWHEDLVLEVMSQVPLVGRSTDESINDAVRVRLRPYLDEAQPGPCRAAILALATLGDVESIASLAALLGSTNQGLRENAHWALRSLTGLNLAPSAETWTRWHQAELAWLVRQKPKEFQHLREPDAAVAAGALREILTHPLAKGELCTALPDLLKSRFPALRVLACRTLADLTAKDAVEKLVWALEDPEPEVKQAAHSALRVLTKLDLPRDPYAWQTATHTEPRGTEL